MTAYRFSFNLVILVLTWLAVCSSSSRLLRENYLLEDEDDSRSVQMETRSRSSECEDKVPTCSEFGGVSQEQFCCTFISFMNQTCPKSCMFCTETSVIPGSPIQGVPLPGAGSSGAPSVVTQQNPCKPPDSSKPPTVGVNPGG